MPILYNARHGLELSLKFAIDRLFESDPIGKKPAPNHDIQAHWTWLRDANIGDSAIRELISGLRPFVASLAGIDDDGQELRYAENRDRQRSMRNVPVVNLPHIRNSLQSMCEILARFRNRVIEFVVERKTGSYTRECSRADLEFIADALGDHATWRDESFNERKTLICARFNFGSHKFSDAVTAIRKSRYLAALVGLEIPLAYLSEEKALFVAARWRESYPAEPSSGGFGSPFAQPDFDKLLEHHRKSVALVNLVAENLTDGELADLDVLFELGRSNLMGEHYDEMLPGALSPFEDYKRRFEAIRHLMTKPNFLEGLFRGSKRAGQPKLAAKIQALMQGE